MFVLLSFTRLRLIFSSKLLPLNMYELLMYLIYIYIYIYIFLINKKIYIEENYLMQKNTRQREKYKGKRKRKRKKKVKDAKYNGES